MTDKVTEISLPNMEKALQSDAEGEVLLSRKEICDQVLNCSVDTADKHFLYKEGFPFVKVGETRKYPKKGVEKWIKENTVYNGRNGTR